MIHTETTKRILATVTILLYVGILFISGYSEAFAAPYTVLERNESEDYIIYREDNPAIGIPSCFKLENATSQTKQKKTTQIDCNTGEKEKSVLSQVLGGALDLGLAALKAIAITVTSIIIEVLGGILVWVANIFGWIIISLTLGMGAFINSDGVSTGLQDAWRIIRDMANIGIIGGLVATAIGTILQNDKYSINKTLARLIIAALLVNFSYFFAGAIIDASNFLTGKIYESVIVLPNCTNNCSFVERVMGVVQLDTLDEQGFSEALKTEEAPKSAVLLYNLFIIIFMLVLLFYFLNAVALFLARFAILVFLLITSPVGIAGAAIPILQNYSKQWWEALFTQALYPAVFLLLAGVGITVLEHLNPAIVQATGGSNSIVGLMIAFLLSVIFLIVAARIATQLSGHAKAFADVYKLAGRLDFSKRYGAMWARGIIGGGSDALLRLYNQRFAANTHRVPIIGGTVDRAIKDTLEAGRSAKMFGEKSYKDLKEERKQRAVDVRDIESEMRQRDALFKKGGALEQFDAAEKEFNRKLQSGEGREEGESLHDFRKRLEDEKTTEVTDKDGKRVKISLSEARAQAQSILNALPSGARERIYDENPQQYVRMATAFTSKQYMEIMEDPKVRRDIKKEMRKKRFGGLMKEMEEADKRMQSGDLVFGSDEYNEIRGDFFVRMRDDMTNEEKMNLIMSSYGQHLRKMQIFWGSTTNGFYTEAEKNPNISRSEIETTIRPFKRQMYRASSLEWTSGQIMLGNEHLVNPEELKLPERQAQLEWAQQRKAELDKGIAKERATLQKKIDEAVQAGDTELAQKYSKKLTAMNDEAALVDMIVAGRTKESLTEQERMVVERAVQGADERIGQWAEGKQPSEVDSEVKDEHFYNAALAKNLTTDQLLGLEHHDRVFMDAVKDNLLIHGDPSVIWWMLTSERGKDKFNPTQKDIDKANAARAKAGMTSIEEEMEKKESAIRR